MNGWERMFGFEKSSPAKFSTPNKAEPVRVNPKLTMNWIVSLRSLPNMIMETRADRTNIQAKEQMKTAMAELEFSSEAMGGMMPSKEDATVFRAD